MWQAKVRRYLGTVVTTGVDSTEVCGGDHPLQLQQVNMTPLGIKRWNVLYPPRINESLKAQYQIQCFHFLQESSTESEDN